MRLLFAISVASFCTVLWIALSLARRLQRHRLKQSRRAPQGPAVEFFEAGEYRTPRPIRLRQQVVSMRTRSAPIDLGAAPVSGLLSANDSADFFENGASGPVRYLWPSALAKAVTNNIAAGERLGGPAAQQRPILGPRADVRGPKAVAEISRAFSSGQAPCVSAVPASGGTKTTSASSDELPDRDLSGERKSPQSVRPGSFRRVDLSHYNKEDMGDLTDPYTHIVRPSGVRRAVKGF